MPRKRSANPSAEALSTTMISESAEIWESKIDCRQRRVSSRVFWLTVKTRDPSAPRRRIRTSAPGAGRQSW